VLGPAAAALSQAPSGAPALLQPPVTSGPASSGGAGLPPTIQDGIGPGSALQVRKGAGDGSFFLCSAAFLLRDPATATYYLSTAGHCLVRDENDPQPYTGAANPDKVMSDVQVCVAGCVDNALSLGTYVDLQANATYHPVAFAQSGGVGQDFGLIQLPATPAIHKLLRPSIPQWGGPVGTDDSKGGDLLVLYGHGTYCCPVVGGAVSRTPADQGRAGVSLGADGDSFTALGWTTGGDSGSGVAIGVPDASGVAHGAQAVGVLTHGVEYVGGEFAGTLLTHGIAMATARTGTAYALVEAGDPLTAAPDPNATASGTGASIAILRPAAGAVVLPDHGAVRIDGDSALRGGAPGQNGTRVELAVDDAGFGPASRVAVVLQPGNGSWSADWSAVRAPAGNHTLHARLVGPGGTLAETSRSFRLVQSPAAAGPSGSHSQSRSGSAPSSDTVHVPGLGLPLLAAGLAATALVRRKT